MEKRDSLAPPSAMEAGQSILARVPIPGIAHEECSQVYQSISRDFRINMSEWGEVYDHLKWVSGAAAQAAEEERKELLTFLEGRVAWGAERTKLDCTNLSPGCRLCMEGAWSCLFINGLCQARCFYCPAEQNSRHEPVTQGIVFSKPRDYIDFIRRFGFRGVGISGGEPFMTFDRTLRFVKEIKKALGDTVYLWVYTNGLLVEPSGLIALKKAGLDEIRFHLNAETYNLEKVKLAVGLVPRVTVEIPAVPEKEGPMQVAVREMRAAGVAHLNLHQLRVTPHNRKFLEARNYTLLHGPKVTVLESELCALRILCFAKEEGIDLPINYCSFVYRHRTQGAGLRKRCAPFLVKPYEKITEAGFIRTLWLQGEQEWLSSVVRGLETSGVPGNLWYLDGPKRRLFFHESIMKKIDLSGQPINVSHYSAELRPSVSYRNPFKEVSLNPRKRVYVERKNILVNKQIQGEEISLFESAFLERRNALNLDGTALEEINELAWMKGGLQEYV